MYIIINYEKIKFVLYKFAIILFGGDNAIYG